MSSNHSSLGLKENSIDSSFCDHCKHPCAQAVSNTRSASSCSAYPLGAPHPQGCSIGSEDQAVMSIHSGCLLQLSGCHLCCLWISSAPHPHLRDLISPSLMLYTKRDLSLKSHGQEQATAFTQDLPSPPKKGKRQQIILANRYTHFWTSAPAYLQGPPKLSSLFHSCLSSCLVYLLRLSLASLDSIPIPGTDWAWEGQLPSDHTLFQQLLVLWSHKGYSSNILPFHYVFKTFRTKFHLGYLIADMEANTIYYQ